MKAHVPVAYLSPLLSSLVSCLLVACAPIRLADTASLAYAIPVTATVVVRQTIPIPPGTAHVVMQDGKLVSTDSLRRYEPFCELEVNDVVDVEQHVRPGRFAVTRLLRQQQLGAERRPVLLAGIVGVADGPRISGLGFGSANAMALDTPLALNVVQLRLHSAEQANVRELRCTGGWAFLPSVAYPSLAEMRGALGPLIGVELD